MKVNTMIIGAGRSGTTSVYEYLDVHPEVSFSITKELHYFSIDDLYARGENYFHSLFPSTEKKIIATADTYLLSDPDAPQRIQQYNPAMQLIIMLRDPVDRAYSNFNYSVNFGHEPADADFFGTIETEKNFIHSSDIAEQNNRCHFYGSLYHKHLTHWLSFFPKQQLHVYLLDDLKKNPDQFYRKLCNDLQIEFVPFQAADKAFNAGTGVKSKRLQQFLLNRNSPLRRATAFCLRPFRNLIIRSGLIDKVYALNRKDVAVQPLSPTDREKAAAYFINDILLLERDLGIQFHK